MNRKILVMGATGQVGTKLIDELLKYDVSIRALTRNPLQVTQRFNTRVEWVEFDILKPATFPNALKAIDSVFMISRPGDEQADTFAKPLIKYIMDSEVDHIVNLSAMGASERPDFSIRKVEILLEDSGINFTHLRPNFFMQIFSSGPLGNSIKTQQKIILPAEDAKLSFVHSGDIATVAAKILSNPIDHINKAYTLTGGEAIDHYQVAEHISNAIGRKVEYYSVQSDDMHKMLQSLSIPEDVIQRLLTMYKFVREGYCSPITECINDITGQPPTTFAKFASEQYSTWL